MSLKNLNNKNKKELTELLEKEQETRESLEFKIAEGQVKNVRALRTAKRNVARILTALTAVGDNE